MLTGSAALLGFPISRARAWEAEWIDSRAVGYQRSLASNVYRAKDAPPDRALKV